MTMTLGDLLEMIRQDYIDHMTAMADDLEEDGAEVMFEPAFRDDKGEVSLEGILKLPARVDLLTKRGEAVEPVQVAAEGVFRFDDSIDITWDNGMSVKVLPFGWDMMPVRMSGVADDQAFEPLQQWFWRWFAEPEELEGPVQEVVHYLGDPERVDGEVRIMADMGTAPLEAWQDLIDACAACGAKSLVIGEAASAEDDSDEE
ncbi:MAG: hypothetical protein DI585_01710 [Pseudomonas fluorescens]|nr:MAG: hypothetical protein DI585_01710 [Pseudomonas fluorescens]